MVKEIAASGQRNLPPLVSLELPLTSRSRGRVWQRRMQEGAGCCGEVPVGGLQGVGGSEVGGVVFNGWGDGGLVGVWGCWWVCFGPLSRGFWVVEGVDLRVAEKVCIVF